MRATAGHVEHALVERESEEVAETRQDVSRTLDQILEAQNEHALIAGVAFARPYGHPPLLGDKDGMGIMAPPSPSLGGYRMRPALHRLQPLLLSHKDAAGIAHDHDHPSVGEEVEDLVNEEDVARGLLATDRLPARIGLVCTSSATT